MGVNCEDEMRYEGLSLLRHRKTFSTCFPVRRFGQPYSSENIMACSEFYYLLFNFFFLKEAFISLKSLCLFVSGELMV